MLNKQTGKWQTVESSERLVQDEQILKGKIRAIDTAIGQLVRYKPYEWGESVDPASMEWMLKELYSKKQQLEAKCLMVRGKIQLQNLHPTISLLE